MSSSMFIDDSNTTTMASTRRPPTANNNQSQRNTERRSISSKFRNLFRKNSTSTGRSVSNDDLSRTRSTSNIRATEAEHERTSVPDSPQLRAPLVVWPFGKKTKTTTTSDSTKNSKTKTKPPKKNKAPMATNGVTSNPIIIDNTRRFSDPETVPRRSTDFTSSAVERISSSINYEPPPTRGFRDYMVIDHAKPHGQLDQTEFNPTKPVSGGFQYQHEVPVDQHYINEVPNHSTTHRIVTALPNPTTDIRVNQYDESNHTIKHATSATATQILASQAPLLPQSNNSTPRLSTASNVNKPNQQQNENQTVTPNRNDRYSTGSTSSLNTDSPKLHPPRFSTSQQLNNDKTRRTGSEVSNHSDGPKHFYSSSGSFDVDRSYERQTRPSNSWETSSSENYPFLSAIIEHHLLRGAPSSIPTVSQLNTSTSPTKAQRFEISTSTFESVGQQQPWPSPFASNRSPTNVPHRSHDSYIRPLTPQYRPNSMESTTIDLHVEDNRNETHHVGPDRSNIRFEDDSQPIYRSSTMIYTSDRHQYVSGGEIRTWSIRENPTLEQTNRNNSTILPIIRNETNHRTGELGEEEQTEDRYVIAYEYDRDQPRYIYDKQIVDQYIAQTSSYRSNETRYPLIRPTSNERGLTQGNKSTHL